MLSNPSGAQNVFILRFCVSDICLKAINIGWILSTFSCQYQYQNVMYASFEGPWGLGFTNYYRTKSANLAIMIIVVKVIYFNFFS